MLAITIGSSIILIYRYVTVLGASVPSTVELLVEVTYYGLVLVGVTIFLFATYADSWRRWGFAKRGRMVILGAAFFLLSLGAADIVTVWTVGMLPNQTLTGSNFFIAEGVDFRAFVTEVGLGALLGVASLVLDLAEEGRL